MARSRFVQPSTTRLELSDGDWIDVKTELTAGERRHVFGRLVKEMRAGGQEALLDPEQVGFTRLAEYILAWSFVDEAGKPVPVSEGAINALESATYVELVKAIDEHEAATDRARELKKKDPATLTASAAT